MITLETEILFREWFKQYLSDYFTYNDTIANQMMNKMPITEITYYWSRFVVDWKEKMKE